MNKLPALQGLLWIRQGIALFRRNPGELIAIMLAYFFVFSSLAMVPLLGPVIWSLLIPGLCLGLLQACRQVAQGETVWSKQLLQGLRMPGLQPQLKLGILWLIGCIVAAIVLYLMLKSIGDGSSLKMFEKQANIDPKLVDQILFAFACATLAQMPFVMALWFAPALVGWHNMSAGKAIFFSFFSVWKAIRAFIVFGLAMVTLMFGLGLMGQLVSMILAPLLGAQFVSVSVLLALLLIVSSIFYCSLYCCYENMFGSESNWQKN